MTRTNNIATLLEQDHPFKCNGCGSCYRASRYAARCCGQSCTDLRNGDVTAFSQAAEDLAVQQDEERWAAIMARAHFECSCAERYDEIDHAIQCRKCRTYTVEGWCTQVVDVNTNEVVWPSAEDRAEQVARDAELAARIAEATDGQGLRFSPFAKLR